MQLSIINCKKLELKLRELIWRNIQLGKILFWEFQSQYQSQNGLLITVTTHKHVFQQVVRMQHLSLQSNVIHKVTWHHSDRIHEIQICNLFFFMWCWIFLEEHQKRKKHGSEICAQRVIDPAPPISAIIFFWGTWNSIDFYDFVKKKWC